MSDLARRAFDGALPTRTETLLLRSSHLPEPSAREAWAAFRSRTGDLIGFLAADRPGRKALAPLLYRALGEQGLPLSDAERTYLKTAYLRERHRSPRFHSIVEEALARLASRGIEPLLLKGTAFGLTLYREPALRHTHDAELLVRESQLAGAVSAFGEADDWTPVQRPAGERDEAFVHRSGMPLVLRVDPFRSPHVEAPAGVLWNRSRPLRATAAGGRTLSTEDDLLVVLGHAAFSPARESLLWACDALRLVDRGDVDWDAFADTAERFRLRIPAYGMTAYLREELEAAVPADALRALERRSRRVSALERDGALRAVRLASGGTRALLRGGRGPVEKFRLAWWTLFPSRAYMRRNVASETGESRPFPYARRLARIVRAALGTPA